MLTGKQLKFIVCLLENSSTAKAIKAAGITKSTAYRWMKDVEFKQELQKRKNELLSSVSGYLQNSLSICCERLMGIINDSDVSAQVKINAISLIFHNARAFTEQAEIMERLQRIEEEFRKQEEYRNDW